jgi:hypothetical protein
MTSDDHRVSRNIGEPAKDAGLATPQLWSAYLDWQRGDLLAGVRGLDPDQQRRSVVPSAWTPLELLSHVAHMEQRWFVWGFLGQPVAEPWGDWDVDPSQGTGGRWRVPASVTAEDVAAHLDAVAARTREVLATHRLDTIAATGGRFEKDPPTLEWICFHVLAEYARHAGHLDLAVELLTVRPGVPA